MMPFWKGFVVGEECHGCSFFFFSYFIFHLVIFLFFFFNLVTFETLNILVISISS